MEAVEVAVLADVAVPKLMGSEVLTGARVCATDGETHDKNGEFTLLLSRRGTSHNPEFSSWAKKGNTESCGRSNGMLSRLATEDSSRGLDHGIPSGSVALTPSCEGKLTQRKVGKVPRNGSGSFKGPRTLQIDNSLPQAETEDSKMELDKLGMHLVKCSNADKSVGVKHKSNMNGKRGDRRNYKVQMKAKYDQFSLKPGLLSVSPASGGSNAFGMYGLKPDIHDVTKLLDEISLDELLDGSYKYPTQGKDKGKKNANVHENILDSVRKACSVLQPRGLQQGKQTEELDIHVNNSSSLLSSPSRTSATNGSDGDESSVTAGLSKCSNDQESSIKFEAPADMNDKPVYQPKDILERLALPPPKDLDSLLLDAVKPAASGKLSDPHSCKPSSHRVILPPFSWSNNFNGHYKSNTDAARLSNKSTCQGRWTRIQSTSNFVGGGGNEGLMELESLTYDDSMVPTGKIKYRLPEIGKNSLTFAGQDSGQQDLSPSVCSTASLLALESGSTSDYKSKALHSPTVLTAAQILCDFGSHCMKHDVNGIMKWQKQHSQRTTKIRKSRSSEKNEEDFASFKFEKKHDHAIRGVECGSSAKKPKTSLVEKREDFSHIQAVIGLSSVSAPRSSRASPSRLSRDSVADARHSNGSFTKPSFMVSPSSRLQDRSNHNPQKLRKLGPMDWNGTRS